MTNDTQRLEHAKWVFERTLGWIATADVKVGAAVAIDTVLVGGLVAAFAASASGARTGWVLLSIVTSLAALAVAIYCAALAAIPRMLGPVKSMIFFARIAEYQEPDYVSQFLKVTERAFLEDLITQIHRNAEIATLKHTWVRKSLTWSFLAAIPWLSAVILLAKA